MRKPNPRTFDPRKEERELSKGRRGAWLQRRLKVGYNPSAAALEEAQQEALRRKKPPEAGLAIPIEPPKGPKPKQGGAAAPLDFGDD